MGVASSVITASCRTGALDRALRTFCWLRVRGIDADLPSLNILLGSCANAGAWEYALQVFDSMRVSKVGFFYLSCIIVAVSSLFSVPVLFLCSLGFSRCFKGVLGVLGVFLGCAKAGC